MAKVKAKSAELFSMLKPLKGITITQVTGGTNQFNVFVATGIDPAKLNKRLRSEHNIVFGLPRGEGSVKIKVNPTLLRRDNRQILEAFRDSLAFARA